MSDARNVFDQPIRNIKTYEKIKKIVTDQGDNCTTGSTLDYPYFKENYKSIAIDLSKQKTFYLDQPDNVWIVFILEKVKETILDFSQETVRELKTQ